MVLHNLPSYKATPPLESSQHKHSLIAVPKKCTQLIKSIIIIVKMASPFGFQVIVLIMAFMASTSISVKTPTVPITSAPALLPSASTSPLSSPSTSTKLSPDISPLLPSPGGRVPSSSIPTIPSNPSLPNPDETPAFGPDSAFSPSGSQPDSSAVPLSSVGVLDLAVLMCLLSMLLSTIVVTPSAS
ncbi:hypothetical protein RJ639_027513 [Escallonia herrerae]|uniref:Uncharacterized protein n=1 Tax=Escallonia herrerae TaxID=1293975 RepID=A0AA89BFG6_9ASTE|nr:hypothetical protein RJ639_027513 [Escallonia herrerae]